MSAAYLQLANAQGGHRFGPFGGGAVYFGTDRSKCQIMLDSSTGLAPCHAVLTIGPNQQFTLSATHANHIVFVVAAGSHQAHQVSRPTPIQPGATIYLGSLQGLQFTLQAASGPSRNAPPGAPGFSNAMGKEVKRQVETHLWTKIPAFRVFQQFFYQYKTGVLTQPRTLIALAVVAVGFLGTLCVGCLGGIFTLFTQFVP